MTDEDERQRRLKTLARWNRQFAEVVPHNRALGLEVLELGEGYARFRLPYDERLVGNPVTRVLHGGAITSLIDACCGSAVFMKLPAPMPIATLDLRIDYLRPAAPDRDVVARADCFRVTRNVAFVRGIAYQEAEDDPIASAAGSFMLSTRMGRRPADEPAAPAAAPGDDDSEGGAAGGSPS